VTASPVETPNFPALEDTGMDRQKIIAIVFTVLMIGSSLAYAATLL